MTRLRFLPHSGQRPFGQTWRRSAPLLAVGKPTGSKEVVKELVKVLEDTDRGLDVTAAQRKMIGEYVDRLQELGEGQTTTGKQMAATWRMLWTTEKETLFLVKNARVFGKVAGDVFQVLDPEKNSLQNVVCLEPKSIFAVDSTLEVVSPQRVNFKFTRAYYQEEGKPPFNLPPFGQGWFENVYLDDDIRIAKDIRKDVLITARYGPPKVF